MYTTETAIENYLMTDIDSSFSSQISAWITAAESYIDNYTQKSFEGTTTTRYFDGNGKREIIVDDFTTLTSVQILQVNSDDVEYTLTEGLDDDYVLYPYNETPYYKLMMVASSSVGVWLRGLKRIKLTGVWGHSAIVPEDIKLVATMLVADIIKQGRDSGEIRSEALGDYSVTYADLDKAAVRLGVKQILDQYQILEVG